MIFKMKKDWFSTFFSEINFFKKIIKKEYIYVFPIFKFVSKLLFSSP
jgi:hypothetical protein